MGNRLYVAICRTTYEAELRRLSLKGKECGRGEDRTDRTRGGRVGRVRQDGQRPGGGAGDRKP